MCVARSCCDASSGGSGWLAPKVARRGGRGASKEGRRGPCCELRAATRNRFYDDLPGDVRRRIELLVHADWLRETVRLMVWGPEPGAARRPGHDLDDGMLHVREFLRALELPVERRDPTRRESRAPPWPKYCRIDCQQAHGVWNGRPSWTLGELHRHMRRVDALDLHVPAAECTYDLVRSTDDFEIVEEYKRRLRLKLRGRHCAKEAALKAWLRAAPHSLAPWLLK